MVLETLREMFMCGSTRHGEHSGIGSLDIKLLKKFSKEDVLSAKKQVASYIYIYIY